MTTCTIDDMLTATPRTHEYAFCDLCDVFVPQTYCYIAEEYVCGYCHAAYTEDYHEE